MTMQVTTEVHRRRFSRNMGVGLGLVGLVGLVFALTVVKVQSLGPGALEGYDHTVRPGLAEVSR